MADKRKYSKAFLDEGWNDFGQYEKLDKEDWYGNNAFPYMCYDMEDNANFKKYPKLLQEEARKYFAGHAVEYPGDYSDDSVKKYTKKFSDDFNSKLTPELIKKYDKLNKINDEIGDIKKSREYKIGKLKRRTRNALIGAGIGANYAYFNKLHPLAGAAFGAGLGGAVKLSDSTKRNIKDKARVKRVKRIYPNYDNELSELNSELNKKIFNKTGGENMGYYKHQIEKCAKELDNDEVDDYFKRRAERIFEEREKAFALLDNDMWLNSLPRNAKHEIKGTITRSVDDSINRGVSAEKSVERALDYTKSLVKNDTIREFNKLTNIRNKIENSNTYKDAYKKNKGVRVKSTLKGAGTGALSGTGLGYLLGKGPGAVVGGLTGTLIGSATGADYGREISHNRAFGTARDKIHPAYHKEMKKAKNKLFKDLYRSWEEED